MWFCPAMRHCARSLPPLLQCPKRRPQFYTGKLHIDQPLVMEGGINSKRAGWDSASAGAAARCMLAG